MSSQFLRGLGDDAATRSEAPLRCPASQRGRRASVACWTSQYGVLKETTDDAARSRLSRLCFRHAQASCSLMRVQTMHLLNAHPHPADPCPLPLR